MASEDLEIAVRFVPRDEESAEVVLEQQLAGNDWTPIDRRSVSLTPRGRVKEEPSRVGFGLNMCWHSDCADYGSVCKFLPWLESFSANGGGLARIILTRWSLGFLPPNFQPDLDRYIDQARAAQLDWLLEQCARLRVAVVLCIFTFSDFRSGSGWDWDKNPLSQDRGGPCRRPLDAFRNSHALIWLESLLRVLAARWGAYQGLVAWEAFNEIDQIDGYVADVCNNWFARFQRCMGKLDAFARPVLVSHSRPDQVKHQLALGVPLVQVHNYNWPATNPAVNAAYWANYFNVTKSGRWLLSEFSLRSDKAPTAEDPKGAFIRNTLWAALFSGWNGPGWPWYWDTHIDQCSLWSIWLPLQRFCQSVDWIRAPWQRVLATLKVTRMLRPRVRKHVAPIRMLNLRMNSLRRLLHERNASQVRNSLRHLVGFIMWQRACRRAGYLSNGLMVLALGRNDAAGAEFAAFIFSTETSPIREGTRAVLHLNSEVQLAAPCVVQFWDPAFPDGPTATGEAELDSASRTVLTIKLPAVGDSVALIVRSSKSPGS